MNAERTFPVMACGSAPEATVPWEFMEPHNLQAIENHGHGLTKLAERGGLCAFQILAVVTGVSDYPASPHDSWDDLQAAVAAWRKGPDEVQA